MIRLQRLTIIIPSIIVVFIVAVFILQQFLDEESDKFQRGPLSLSKSLSDINYDSKKQDNMDYKSRLLASYAKDDLAIFYNAYIPSSNISNALRIIKEQLASRASSPTLNMSTLYYTHIGALNVTFPPCNNCILLNAVPEGDEVLTLQALHDYCTVNPSGRAIYVHAKGSFTLNERNERLRRVLTKGAFSDECTKMPRYKPGNGETCNVCMGKFVGMPFHCSPGNMFVAECEYVKHLIPPRDFTKRKDEVTSKLWNMTQEELQIELGLGKKLDDGNWKGTEWQFLRPSWVGTERYAMEHWMFSHPTIQPCDVFDKKFAYPKPPLPEDVTAQWGLGPREVRSDFRMKIHPFFLLPGRLYNFRRLYQAAPPKSSWMYNFYAN